MKGIAAAEEEEAKKKETKRIDISQPIHSWFYFIIYSHGLA